MEITKKLLIKLDTIYKTQKVINKFSIIISLHNNNKIKVISLNSIKYLSKKMNFSSQKLEIIALENKIIPERFIKNTKTISTDEQLKLIKTKICILGLGGLGNSVLENLTRIGIGKLKLIDKDIFESHNLNRQIISSSDNIGKLKVLTAMKRSIQINSSISVDAFSNFLNKNNSNKLINNCQITIDCLDNIKSRLLLEKESAKKKVPMISAATAGTTGFVTTILPNTKILKTIFKNSSKNHGVETKLGCISYVVSIIAAIECCEVVKILLKEKTLNKKLLIIDTKDYTLESLKMS